MRYTIYNKEKKTYNYDTIFHYDGVTDEMLLIQIIYYGSLVSTINNVHYESYT